jgi:hypothetical protein
VVEVAVSEEDMRETHTLLLQYGGEAFRLSTGVYGYSGALIVGYQIAIGLERANGDSQYLHRAVYLMLCVQN